MARSPAASLRSAAQVAVIGGFLLGCRESLSSLLVNAFAQPGQYAWLYVSVPILAWVGLALALLLPSALVAGRLQPPPGAWVYGFVLGLAGAASFLLPELGAISQRLADVGHSSSLGFAAVLWGGSTLVAIAIAAVAAAAVAWLTERRPRALRAAAVGTAAATLVCVAPPALFFASDWKWGVAAAGRSAASPSDKPNVVLISIDTLRADHLGIYGASGDPTPHLDRLARDGVVFEQTVTASPWTLPAVASLFTGSYPRRHGAGVINNGRSPLGRSSLPPGTPTFATILQEAGYRSAAIVTNPYLSLRYGLGEGFDEYANVTIESEAYLSFRDTTLVRLAAWLRPDLALGDRGEVISQRAVAWLDANATSQPFFLWLHYVDPHPPYNRAGAAGHKSFRGDTLLGSSGRSLDLTLSSPDVARLRSGEIRLNLGEKEAVHELYRAEVRSVDAAVGQVLDELDRLGLARNTLVVCVADHGEEFWEHGGVEHGHAVYEEVVRIPLLLRWPGGIAPGQRVEALASIVDVAPTVLNLLGLPPAENADGIALLRSGSGEGASPREVLIENLLFADERVGLRTPDHKYVRWEIGKEEAYDLTADPGERRDLAGLDSILLPLRHLFARADAAAPKVDEASTTPPLDAATVEALRALGYSH